MHLTRWLPSVEVFSMLWQHQLEYLDRSGQVNLSGWLRRHYLKTYTLAQLTAFSSIVMCSDDPTELFLWADWHSGCYTSLPSSACGSQPVEAYHSSWQGKRPMGRSAKSVRRALEVYRRMTTLIVSRMDDSPQSLHATAHDMRQFHIDGLLNLGEASAVDLHAHHKRFHNHVTVASANFPGTSYVVFKHLLYWQTDEPDEPATPEPPPADTQPIRKAKRGKLLGGLLTASHHRLARLQRARAERAMKRKCQSKFRERHPASIEVDDEAAAQAASLVESFGAPLLAKLRFLNIVPDTADLGIRLKALRTTLSSFAIVTAGTRAAQVTRDSDHCLLCSCSRFGARGLRN